jgi:SAM-dependent methyltransferase
LKNPVVPKLEISDMSLETEGIFKRAFRGLCIEASIRTGIFDRSIFSVYNYMFSPSQLIFLTQCLVDTRHIPGCCVEIGCAQGRTTAFLRKFMDENGIVKDYYALDTFSGFVAEHVDYEVDRRSKDPDIKRVFVTNKQKWFDHSLEISGVGAVESVECDATKFDFDRLGPIAFALLDVDLYLPMIDILPKLYRNLSAGGIILVDDCMTDELWDGALAAYEEFVSRSEVEHNIVFDKIGIIRKS